MSFHLCSASLGFFMESRDFGVTPVLSEYLWQAFSTFTFIYLGGQPCLIITRRHVQGCMAIFDVFPVSMSRGWAKRSIIMQLVTKSTYSAVNIKNRSMAKMQLAFVADKTYFSELSDSSTAQVTCKETPCCFPLASA